MAMRGAENPKVCPEGRAPRSSQKNTIRNSQARKTQSETVSQGSGAKDRVA